LLSYSSVWFNPHVLYRERAVIVFWMAGPLLGRGKRGRGPGPHATTKNKI
jgi:hypothetical protein